MDPLPRARNLRRWLSALVRHGKLIRTGKSTAIRYRLPEFPVPKPPVFGSPVGQAIHRLITQPLAEWTPADYRRVVLDRYRPNETYYLPPDVRARIAASGDGAAWRKKPAIDAALTALTSRCLSLESAMEPSRAAPAMAGPRRAGGAPSLLTQPLTDAEVTAWLSQPEHPGARGEAHLLWGIRAGFVGLVNAGPTLTVTPSLLAHVYQQLKSQLDAAVRGPSPAVIRRDLRTPGSDAVGLPAAGHEPFGARSLLRAEFCEVRVGYLSPYR